MILKFKANESQRRDNAIKQLQQAKQRFFVQSLPKGKTHIVVNTPV
jgi:hypothetical protein